MFVSYLYSCIRFSVCILILLFICRAWCHVTTRTSSPWRCVENVIVWVVNRYLMTRTFKLLLKVLHPHHVFTLKVLMRLRTSWWLRQKSRLYPWQWCGWRKNSHSTSGCSNVVHHIHNCIIYVSEVSRWSVPIPACDFPDVHLESSQGSFSGKYATLGGCIIDFVFY